MTPPIKHGTRAGYQRCVLRPEGSCVECRQADRAYVERWRLNASLPIRHGTLTGYARCFRQPGGSCEPCRKAHSTYQKKWRTEHQ